MMTLIESPKRIVTPLGLTIDPKKLEERVKKLKEFGDQCSQIYEELKPQLTLQHPGWFIAVNPYTQEYLLSDSRTDLSYQIKQKYKGCRTPQVTVFRLAENRTVGALL
ncbi:MAG: hypothetical protein ACRC8A_16820 [Microcoleaceae cyanobacterium]